MRVILWGDSLVTFVKIVHTSSFPSSPTQSAFLCSHGFQGYNKWLSVDYHFSCITKPSSGYIKPMLKLSEMINCIFLEIILEFVANCEQTCFLHCDELCTIESSIPNVYELVQTETCWEQSALSSYQDSIWIFDLKHTQSSQTIEDQCRDAVSILVEGC